MGDAVAVECRATGRPRPTLTWKRQGSTLQLLPREVNDANVLQVRERHHGTRRDEKPLRESINFLLVKREITTEGTLKHFAQPGENQLKPSRASKGVASAGISSLIGRNLKQI